MEITYLGHSSFRLKGKQGIVVTDPYDKSVGFSYPSTTADIVTVSHGHADHSNSGAVKPTPTREKPFLIHAAGEYEISGISVFGYPAFHDDDSGKERGRNIVYTIIIDGVTIAHLGDLGHTLSDSFIEKLGTVDVLLCPVGGKFTIDSKAAVDIIQEIEPSYVIPMHYKTEAHDPKGFGELQTLADFEKEFGVTVEPVKSLTVVAGSMPEQTTLVALSS
ncbi:MAG: MBL fold metallo-hydrolase [Candidatus Woesebacteria bacterium]